MELTNEIIAERLKSYPGAHPNEKWKLEIDLNKCTTREKQEISKAGRTIDDLMALGMNRGEVAHVLFGFRHTSNRQ